MNIKQLEQFISGNHVRSVVLFHVDTGFEVWAYDFEDENVVGSYGNRLSAVRGNEPRMYTSVQRAYDSLRGMGYAGAIVIEG